MKPKPITLDLANLPDDMALLKDLVRDMAGQIAKLQHQLHEALRRHFGRKAETIDASQLHLFLQQIEKQIGQIPKPTAQEEAPTVEIAGHGRRKPSKTLPREITRYPLPEDKKSCPECGGALHKIGEESSTLVDYVPATILLRERVAEKWACGKCQGPVVASELPPKPIERGMADAGLLAHVVTSKFCDHLPLYRQAEIFKRQGFEVKRSTLCDWVGQVSGLLDPIYRVMKHEVLQSKKINTDDTPIPVLSKPDKKDGPRPPGKKARLGRIWVYCGDEDHPHTVFDYSPDRKGLRPRTFLEGWKGYLQADAFTGYDAMYRQGRITEVACWAHARRKFFEAQDTDQAGASEAMAYIRKLYDVETEAKDLKPGQRKELRQREAKPVMAAFHKWLKAKALITLPKSALGEAMAYALNQWEALGVYLTDGDLAIDNNAAENALRGVCLGRKNWLFAGSDDGGERAAVLFSLVASCKRHGVEPFAYLRDVIARVASHPASRIGELLPATWRPAA